MEISAGLKIYRRNRGWSQSRLARESGLSVPQIQRLEAGRGNPTWQTLETLGKCLGFVPELRPGVFDWDEFARLTGTLLESRPYPKTSSIRLSARSLCRCVWNAWTDLKLNPDMPDFGRKRDAVLGTLWAMYTHYPSVYRKEFRKIDLWQQEMDPGRRIRLRNLALSRIAEFL